MYDLLDLTNDILAVRWDAKAKTFVVSDLLAVECTTFDDVMTVVTEGYKNRRIGSTALNKDSSRSHRCGVRLPWRVGGVSGGGGLNASQCQCTKCRKQPPMWTARLG